jgi:2-octaprenyl-6-methoxyphenol hydroxylase
MHRAVLGGNMPDGSAPAYHHIDDMNKLINQEFEMSASPPTDMAARADVVVAGGGATGLAAALALAQLGCRVVCAGPPFPPAGPGDTRTTALLAQSIAFLDRIGVWSLCHQSAAPLSVLRIIDDTGRLLRAPDIEFCSSELGPEPFGYNIPNRVLVSALHTAIERSDGLRYVPTAGIVAIDCQPDQVRFTLAEGTQITGRLGVGADGRKSISRRAAGIEARVWSYPQTAIACNFDHTEPHNNICTELHRAAGPFTVVPLPGNSSSLVWVETPEEAARLMALGEDAFAAALESRLYGSLGRITRVGPRGGFALSGLIALQSARNRIMLVGESAHVVPPIGAQGLNLGYRDVADLVGVIECEWARGGDIGASRVISAYNDARRTDVRTRTLAADLLNRTLYADFPGFQLARGAGLHLLNTLTPLRRLVMRQGITPGRLAR